MAWQFERVAGPFSFAEGPVWWRGAVVLFTDIRNNRIMRFDPLSNACDEFLADTGAANGLAVDHQQRLLACAGGARRVVRYELDGQVTVLADAFEGRRLNSPNDLVVDHRGRVWFTDPRYGDRAQMELDHDSVYRLDPPGGVPDAPGPWPITRVTFDTTRPNGLVFAPDEATLYVAESPPAPHGARQLRAYPVDPDGSLGSPRVLHDFGPDRGIDGMRVDSAGNVVAYGWDKGGPGPRIGVFSPNASGAPGGPDGAEIEHHPVPHNPTNCTFGDHDLGSLYVTDYTGSLLRARTDRQGLRREPPTAGAAGR